MLKRLVATAARTCLTPVPFRNFAIIPAEYAKETDHLNQPLLDLYAKRMRKIILDRTVLEKNRIIVPAVRVREVDDTLEKLRKDNLCAGVISERDEFPDLDIVLQSRQITRLKRREQTFTESYYVKVNEELIRCTLADVNFHHLQNWIIQVKFNRYIPGRPNLLYLPVRIKDTWNNKFINKGADIAHKIEGVWVYSYNDDYPVCLEVDPSSVTPNRGYKLGDLSNVLPDGLVLHSKYKNQLHSHIVSISEAKDKILAKELELLDFKKRLKSGNVGMTEEEMEKYLHESDNVPETEEDKIARQAREERRAKMLEKAKKRPPKSLKKLVAQMNFKIKEGVAASVGGKETKGGSAHKEG